MKKIAITTTIRYAAYFTSSIDASRKYARRPNNLPTLPNYSTYPPLRYSSPVDLKGLVLDLRGNPGGLLDAAVEIASYLVPSKSDIVSAKSRNGEEVIYRSVIDPIRPPGMKLAVMVSALSSPCMFFLFYFFCSVMFAVVLPIISMIARCREIFMCCHQ